MEDFESALAEIKPAFGAVTETLAAYCLNGMIDFGEPFRHLLATCQTLVGQVCPNVGLLQTPKQTPKGYRPCLLPPAGHLPGARRAASARMDMLLQALRDFCNKQRVLPSA